MGIAQLAETCESKPEEDEKLCLIVGSHALTHLFALSNGRMIAQWPLWVAIIEVGWLLAHDPCILPLVEHSFKARQPDRAAISAALFVAFLVGFLRRQRRP